MVAYFNAQVKCRPPEKYCRPPVDVMRPHGSAFTGMVEPAIRTKQTPPLKHEHKIIFDMEQSLETFADSLSC